MKGQVLCHNEFTIVGRISDDVEDIDDRVRVLILCPNDDDYSELANKIYVDFNNKDKSIISNMIGHPIAVTGHIEYNNKLILISDMYRFIN